MDDFPAYTSWRSSSSEVVSGVVGFLHWGGQWEKVTFWLAQSTLGLWCVSQECPMITDCCPKLVTASLVHSSWDPMCRRASTSSVMKPFSFRVPSTLCTGISPGRGVVSKLCHQTKSQLMNMPVAPESRRVDTVMGRSKVVGHRFIVRFREQGDFFERMYILGMTF